MYVCMYSVSYTQCYSTCTRQTDLDHSVCRSRHKPFIARFHIDTTNPTLVTTYHLKHTHTTAQYSWQLLLLLLLVLSRFRGPDTTMLHFLITADCPSYTAVQLGDRAFPVATAHTWNSPHPLCLFSEDA